MQNHLKMTAIELKHVLINRIAEIDDVPFLQAIKTILDTNKETKVLKLTPEQRHEIAASKKEIEQGLFYEDAIIQQTVQKQFLKGYADSDSIYDHY